MSTKTKLLSLLILILLFLPVLINPRQPGVVLGINEDRTGSINILDESDSQGAIAGGVIENKLENTSTTESTVSGLAILDAEAETSVVTNKFNLASEIEVTSNGNTEDLIVSKVDETISDDIALVLDKETFKLLGGNPEIETQIEVSVSKLK